MLRTQSLIIGAGQCGLAVSYELGRRGVDHVVLDAGTAGQSWHARRWDSLRLLTPNWMNVLAGESAETDPDGYMTAAQFAGAFGRFVARNNTPLIADQAVRAVRRVGEGFVTQTQDTEIISGSVVIATGACARPRVPVFAAGIPNRIVQLSPINYRNPSQLPSGRVLVVGASASGLQISRELAIAGRDVTLSVGQHTRLPRTYRGSDILTWMHLIGAFDAPYTKVDDLERVRRTPSLPLIGTPEQVDLNLNTLQALGVRIVGRTADIRDGRALFSGNLANLCASADLKLKRLLNRIDDWADQCGSPNMAAVSPTMESTKVPSDPELSMSLDDIATVIWATGFTPDHSFLRMPVFDRKERLNHSGGVVMPGLYAMGLPHMRTARSVHIDGAWRDAKAIARQIQHHNNLSMAA